MPFISFICFFIFLAFLITGFKRNAEFLSPARIYIMLWAFVLAMVEYKFSRLQFKWSSFDWLIVLLGVTSFIIGIYLSFIINLNKPFHNVSEIRIRIRELSVNENKLFWVIIIYFFICLISFIAEWQIEGYIPLFTSDPDKARVMFGIFGLHYILQSIIVVLFLIIEYFILINKNRFKKTLLSLVFLLSLGNYILFVQRYGLFILLMMGFCLFYYSGRKIRPRTIIIFTAILIGLIAGIQSLRTTQLGLEYFYLESQMKFPSSYAGYTIPYMYISMNIENFVKYYPQIPHTFGFYTFGFITDILKAFVVDYHNFDKFSLHIGGYNTFPFFWAYYYDFGTIGLSIIPLIIGFIISEVYYYLHRNPNIVILTLYCIAFTVIILSFNSDPLTRFDTMLPFTVIVLVQFLIINKSEDKSEFKAEIG